MADDSGSISQRRLEIRDTLAPRVVAEPLKTKIETELSKRTADPTRQASPTQYEVIIEINLDNPDGRVVARDRIKTILKSLLGDSLANAIRRNRDASRSIDAAPSRRHAPAWRWKCSHSAKLLSGRVARS